ncbi:MAG: bifunctional metallophosphatase/5'-nucleotidase [Candidatus Delongbacteria bacterium]|nr:bifunctional metallophosphatase/5'-nucleotidase [Candidatus Delongbacteria bacterium]
MKKFIFLLIVTLIFLSCSKAGSEKYTLLTVNSMNGQIFPKVKNNIKFGGFSLLSSNVKKIRSDKINGEVILLGNSNFIYGEVETYFTSGKAVIDLMNEIGFNCMVIGHREFYFGFDVLESLSKRAKFPFISANIVKKDSSRFDFIKPYYIMPDNKTAIIGISSLKVIKANLEKDISEILLLDPSESLAKYSKLLRKKGINKIIAVGDFMCVAEGDKSLKNYQFSEIIENSDIDVLIGTSNEKDRMDTNCICNTIKSIKLLSSDIDGNEMLLYSYNLKTGIEESQIFKINSNNSEPDKELSRTLHELNELVKETAGQVLGISEDEISHLEGNLFNRESYLGDLISDIIREYTNTDIMLLNSGKVRNGFSKGPITLMDLYNILPYEGTVVKVSMTGKQLLRVLESSCALKMSKSFLQVSGIKFKFDLSKNIYKRVLAESVIIGGEKLQPEKKYSVSLTKYIFDGGDQYSEFSDMGIELEMVFQKQMREIIKQYIQSNKTIRIHENSRITEINDYKL